MNEITQLEKAPCMVCLASGVEDFLDDARACTACDGSGFVLILPEATAEFITATRRI